MPDVCTCNIFGSDHADNCPSLERTDVVNQPPHYTFGSVEVIDALEAWDLGFHAGNVVKYVARAKHKGNELQDLKKARWYLERLIAQIETSQS